MGPAPTTGRRSEQDMKQHRTLTPALSYPMGEGELIPHWGELGIGSFAIGLGGYIYFDHVTGSQYHGAVKSADLLQWEDNFQAGFVPARRHHGSVFAKPQCESKSPQPRTTK